MSRRPRTRAQLFSLLTRSEIDEHTASIPPLIAELDLAAPADLLERCRAAQLEVAVLERRRADEIAVLEPFLLRTEAIASSGPGPRRQPCSPC